jgi:uncharacterized membrane protein (DUF2068 family)
MGRDTSQLGVRVIVVYKLIKAGAELVLAAVLTLVLIGGEQSRAHDVAMALGRHVTGAWSLELTALIARAAAPHSVELAIVALVLDGALTLGEGWALYRGFAWAPWIVVVTTGSLIPFELFELARRPRASRVLIVAANAMIVAYLAARAARDRRARGT